MKINGIEIVASRELTRVRQDGVKSIIKVEITQPYLIKTTGSFDIWRCITSISGLGEKPIVHEWDGADSISALSTAICFPGQFLSRLPIAAEFEWSQAPNFLFPEMPIDKLREAAVKVGLRKAS